MGQILYQALRLKGEQKAGTVFCPSRTFSVIEETHVIPVFTRIMQVAAVMSTVMECYLMPQNDIIVSFVRGCRGSPSFPYPQEASS